MKKFRFRLERILEYRTAVKEEKRRELAKITFRLREEEDHLMELMQAELSNEVNEQGVIDANHFVMAQLYAARLKEEITLQREQIVKTEEEVETARQVYVEAAKEAKALETLKQRRQEEYKEYVTREEDKFLDELVTQRSGRVHRIGDE